VARILSPRDESWYDELKAVAYYGESEHERSIRQHVKSLFPGHHVFPFKKDVIQKITSVRKRPDLAMVRRDFGQWGIIEVEVAQHSLPHVLDQTRVFSRGDYNALEVAEYMRTQLNKHCRKNASVDRLAKLLRSVPPTILVLTDTHAHEWEEQLTQEDVNLCIFQVYKSAHGSLLYRTHGAYPFVATHEAHVRRHPSLSNVFQIVGAFEFHRLGARKEVKIVFDDRLTRWRVFEDSGANYIRFIGTMNPLSPNAEYCLVRNRENRYRFERS